MARTDYVHVIGLIYKKIIGNFKDIIYLLINIKVKIINLSSNKLSQSLLMLEVGNPAQFCIYQNPT